jgi:hypothetical protein
MMKTISNDDPTEEQKKPTWKSSKVRPLTTDERASFLILSLTPKGSPSHADS